MTSTVWHERPGTLTRRKSAPDVKEIMDARTREAVPFLDLSLQNLEVAKEIEQGMRDVVRSSAFVLGPDVSKFELEFAEFCGVRHCLGVGNGTDALEIALRATDLARGAEVVIPANTFVATAEAVVRAGAKVVLADCDDDALLDPRQVAAAVGPNTAGVIAVHLYGQMAPMSAIRAAVPDGSIIVEDAAQAQGAAQGDALAGGLGDIAATSFYPGKNLGAFGDAGAVLTDSTIFDHKARALSNHGGTRKYEHLVVGTNSRLDSLQAVVLRAKLARLTEWNRQRSAAAAFYEELLGDVETVRTPRQVPGNRHVWHLYVVEVSSRDRAFERLTSAGIGVGIHYPLPIHRIAAFDFLGYRAGQFPVSERLAAHSLSLPMFPGISRDQQARVADAVIRACA